MEPPSTYSVSVVTDLETPVDTAHLGQVVSQTLRMEAARSCEVRILLTSDERIRSLNRLYRHLDEPTDVLTFAEGEGDCSGDIAISVPFASAQAQLRGIGLQEEAALLAMHGALHLTGWDDETEPQRDAMVLRMNEIAAQISLPVLEEWGSILHAEVAS